MIGSGKLMIVASASGGGPTPPPSPLSAYCSPTSLVLTSSNGVATSALVEVFASGGDKPYSYSWEIDDNNIQVLNPDGKSTRFKASGYNREATGIAKCTVSDVSGAQKVVSCIVSFFFSQSGNQLLL